MSVLPPPTSPFYALIGLEIGVIYGLAALTFIGGAAVLYPVAGWFAGKIVGAIFR